MIVTDVMAAGVEPAGHAANLVTGLEHGLQGFIGFRPETGPVNLVPEPQVALRSGHEPRLGKTSPPHGSLTPSSVVVPVMERQTETARIRFRAASACSTETTRVPLSSISDIPTSVNDESDTTAW